MRGRLWCKGRSTGVIAATTIATVTGTGMATGTASAIASACGVPASTKTNGATGDKATAAGTITSVAAVGGRSQKSESVTVAREILAMMSPSSQGIAERACACRPTPSPRHNIYSIMQRTHLAGISLIAAKTLVWGLVERR